MSGENDRESYIIGCTAGFVFLPSSAIFQIEIDERPFTVELRDLVAAPGNLRGVVSKSAGLYIRCYGNDERAFIDHAQADAPPSS